MKFDAKLNADRFKGFANVYDDARPIMPEYAAEIITQYLGHKPDVVIDLGCGTGLSTLIWEGRCNHAIGIEPSEDMLKKAMEKASDTLSFIQAFSNDTTLDNETADAVVCSQSFHWMEPTETLREIDRILKPGGIFATVDCDWPPVCSWVAELAYNTLMQSVREVSNKSADQNSRAHQWDKNKHLENMQQSGYFRYCREIVFYNREQGSAERFINIAKSQGALQSILKSNPEAIAPQIEEFEEKIHTILGDNFTIDFCYRMRIGVK